MESRCFVLCALLIMIPLGWHFYEYILKERKSSTERDILEFSKHLYDIETEYTDEIVDEFYHDKNLQLKGEYKKQPILPECIAAEFCRNVSATVYLLAGLHDNYQLNTQVIEVPTETSTQKETEFLYAILKTPIMEKTMKFLRSKGAVGNNNVEQLRLLHDIWFTKYSRGDGNMGSTGFEHVFMAELNDASVLGFHNWVYYRKQHALQHLVHEITLKRVLLHEGRDQQLMALRLTFHNNFTHHTTCFYGTSPELEMSLYTVCFLLNGDRPCGVQLGSTKVTIFTHSIQLNEKRVIGTACPKIN